MKNKITKIFYVAMANILLLPNITQGQAFSNPIGFDTFADVAKAITGVVVQVGTVVVVLAIIYSGYLFVTAQGNDEKISTAKRTFVWVVVGAIIVLGAQILGEVVCTTAGEFGGTSCSTSL